MLGNSIFGSSLKAPGSRVVVLGVLAILAILLVAGVVLIFSLPDANAFDARVEQLFIENDMLTGAAEIKLLEILAESGTAFGGVLASYRMIIFVLLVFSVAMMIAALVFLVTIFALNRRMEEVERSGIQINSLLISREERTVLLERKASAGKFYLRF